MRVSSKKDFILCSIKDHKELNVDFENELGNNVDIEKQLENELDLLEMILKWIGKLMLIMIKVLKKKMKKKMVSKNKRNSTCSFDEEQKKNENKNIISDFVTK